MGIKRITRALATLLPLVFVLCHCRATGGHELGSEMSSETEHPWFDSAGKGGNCDPPARACPGFKDEKAFVDVCVAKGFQAKTCGCAMRCSGPVAMPNAGGGTPPAPAAAAPATGSATGVAPDPGKACAPDAQAFIAAAAAAREPGSGLDRCMESHVCNGNLGWCSPTDEKTTAKLRALARQGCEADVLGAVCKDGYLEALACPEDDVRKLSKVWADFYSKDSGVKRCIRNFVCSDDKMTCDAEALKQAQAVKKSVDRDGCEYWLRVYCSIGAKSW